MHGHGIGVARQPGFLGSEDEDGRQPQRHAAKDLLDRRQRAAPAQAGGRIAIQRVLADVEVEGGEVSGEEGRKARHDALGVETRVGVAQLAVELGEPVQHEALEFGHVGRLDREPGFVVPERAEHPPQRVAQLLVGLDEGLENLLPDAQVVRIVGGGDPQAKNVGAGILDYGLRRDDVADALRHLAPVLVEHEAVGQHGVIGSPAPRAAALQQRGMEPAAVLVGALEVHDLVRSAVAQAADAGEAGELFGTLQREGVGRAGVEPHIQHVVDLLPGLTRAITEEALARAVGVPSIGALGGEGFEDVRVDGRVDQRPVLGIDEHRDGHAPGALARDHPVRPVGDHAVDARLARRRHPARARDLFERDSSEGRLIGQLDVRAAEQKLFLRVRQEWLVQRDEPLRRVAEDQRLLRAPGMRILVLQPPARDEGAAGDQRLDHGLIGVALGTLVVKHTPAGEARRIRREEAVGIDGVGNARIDAALAQHAVRRHPDVEVVAAVRGRGVDEARAGVVGDVVAVEEGHTKIITSAK